MEINSQKRLVLGVTRTRNFFMLVLPKNEDNRIKSINNNQEKVVTTQTKIEVVYIEYFHHVFHSSNPFAHDTLKGAQFVKCKITPTINDFLSSKFTKEEVATTLKQIAPLKSLNLDGFKSSFYQSY